MCLKFTSFNKFTSKLKTKLRGQYSRFFIKKKARGLQETDSEQQNQKKNRNKTPNAKQSRLDGHLFFICFIRKIFSKPNLTKMF